MKFSLPHPTPPPKMHDDRQYYESLCCATSREPFIDIYCYYWNIARVYRAALLWCPPQLLNDEEGVASSGDKWCHGTIRPEVCGGETLIGQKKNKTEIIFITSRTAHDRVNMVVRLEGSLVGLILPGPYICLLTRNERTSSLFYLCLDGLLVGAEWAKLAPWSTSILRTCSGNGYLQCKCVYYVYIPVYVSVISDF